MKITLSMLICLCSMSIGCQVPQFDWARDFGGSGSDKAYAAAVDVNGNLYSAGSFKNSVDFDPGTSNDIHTSAGGSDAFLSKFDPNGNHLWTYTVGSADIWEEGYSVITDDDTNVYFTGNFENTVDFDPGPSTFNLTSGGNLDVFIVKLSQHGEFIWAIQFSGTGEDQSNHLRMDALGNIYCSGTFQNTVDFDPGVGTVSLSGDFYDLFLAKLDSDGNLIWVRSFGGPNSQHSDNLYVSDSGEILLTGAFSNSIDVDPGSGISTLTQYGWNNNSFLVSLDTDGNMLWFHHYFATDEFIIDAVTRDENGNILLAGNWLGTADFDYGSGTTSLFTVGSHDAFILKLDPNGEFNFVKSVGYFYFEKVSDIVTLNGKIYVTGQFILSMDMDPGPDVDLFNSTLDHDHFILILHENGDYIGGMQLAGMTSGEPGGGLSVTTTGELYMTSFFENNTDLNPEAGNNYSVSSNGEKDAFVLKLITCPKPSISLAVDGVTLSTTVSANSYQWIDCGKGNSPITGATSPTYMAEENSDFALVVTYDSYCTDTSDCINVSSAGIKSSQQTWLLAYPNPTTSLISLEFPIGTTFSLYNCMGQLLKSWEPTESSDILDLSEFPDGVYVLEAAQENGIEIHRFVKQH